MADADFEDDLFADLYEDDAKPEPVKTETTSAPPVVNGSTVKTEEAIKSEPDAPNGQNTKAEEEEDDDDDIDINLGGNSDHQAAPQQNHHEEHGYSRGPPGGHKDDGKMFIGGLNWETTDESLKDYFSQFGEVLECTVMRDGASGRSRGFGFLTFKDARTVNVVMVKEHYLDGKIIDPKRAIPRDEQERTSKIFVGGVSQEASEGDFKEYFMQFGRVVDATLMMDKDTGRPRGFGFVTFDSEEAVERCLSMPLEILGKAIEVKKAQPRGNVRDEEGAGHGGGGKFRGEQGQGGHGYGNPNNQQMGGMGAMGGMPGMTPQLMAQYWQRMQQYMVMMQQQQQMMGARGGMGAMQGGMNPMMMQQFQAMQAAQQQGGMGGGRSMSPGGMGGGMGQMNPMMMQQMMQQQQQGQHQGQGFNGNAGQGQMSPSGPVMSPTQGRGPSPATSARAPSAQPSYSAYEQQQFEQQKYEAAAAQQGQAGAGPQSYPNQHPGNGGGKKRQASQQPVGPGAPGGPQPKFGQPTSWEGMYDDVPQPGGGPNKKQRGGSGTPQLAPNPNAPVGAPTGPKNAGKPGANYRGGGRGSRGGFHPYSR